MNSFQGNCLGGPYDQQMLAHWSKTMEFFEPLMQPLDGFSFLSLRSLDDLQVVPRKIGEYRFAERNKHWVWIAS